MGLNKVGLRLEKKVTNNIKTLNRYVRELKTPQSIGLDILQVQSTNLAIFGPYTIIAGKYLTLSIGTSVLNETLTLWNFSFTVYIDPTSINPVTGIPDAANQFPSGANLTSGILGTTQLQNWQDWADSSDSTNSRTYKIRIVNGDTVSHTYYYVFRAYLPSSS
jgi:Flp pilus assembly protein TadG